MLFILPLCLVATLQSTLTGTFRVISVDGMGPLKDSFTANHINVTSDRPNHLQFTIQDLPVAIDCDPIFNSGVVTLKNTQGNFTVHSNPPFVLIRADLNDLGTVQLSLLSASIIRVIYARKGDVVVVHLEKPISTLERLALLRDVRVLLFLAIPLLLLITALVVRSQQQQPKMKTD